MKIRSGFVSNSSSSSFVAVGFNLPKDFSLVKIAEKFFGDEETFPKRKESERYRNCGHTDSGDIFCLKCGKPIWTLNDYNEEYKEDVYFYWQNAIIDEGLIHLGSEDKKNFIGIALVSMSSEEGYLKNTEQPLKDLAFEAEQLRKRLGLAEQEVVILTGTRAC